MPADVPDASFANYLTCDLPFGYAPSAPLVLPFGAALRESHRKSVIDLQSAFLGRAEALAVPLPQVAYVASLKHDAVLAFLSKGPLQFCGIADQKNYNDTQQRWKDLRKKARAAMDAASAHHGERLVLLQRENTKIEDAKEKLRATIAAGYTALEPLPPEPIELAPPKGWAAWFNLPIKIAEESKEETKAWLRQDSYLRLCQKVVYSVTALPPVVRRHGLFNLPVCLEAMEALQAERAELQARYLAPHL